MTEQRDEKKQSPVEEITAVRAINVTGTMFDCVVKFRHLPDPVPFTATPDDPEPHGQQIYAAIIAGEAGEITPYAPPPVRDQALRAINETEQKNPITHRALREFFIGFGDAFPDFKQTLLYQRVKAVDDAIVVERNKL